jgi:hypothetical protein
MIAAIAAIVLATAASACGSGGSASGAGASSSSSQASSGSGEVVVRVGSTPITRAEVSHWMQTVAGGSYYELSGRQTLPAGLVSDPPNYGQCVARLEAAAAAAPNKTYQASGVQLLSKCRELNLQLRLSAVGLLVSIQFTLGLARSGGVSVSDAETLAALDKGNAERFSTPAALSANQAARRISIADELLLMKKDILANRLLSKLNGPGGAGFLPRAEAEWAAKTDCKPGYVVEHCKQYRGEAPHTAATPPSGAVLLEQIAALLTGRCTNLPACGKQ